MFDLDLQELGIVGELNPKKKKKKKAKKRRTYSNLPKKRRRRRSSKPKARRRSRPKMTVYINSPQKDIIKSLGDAAIVAAGTIGAVAAAGVAEDKIAFVKENPWAPGAVMVAAGIAAGLALKGKYRPLGTKLMLGASGGGIVALVKPYIEGKLPGFEEGVPAAGYGAYMTSDELGTGAYLPEMSGYVATEPGVGAASPEELDVFGLTEDDIFPGATPMF